MDNSILNGVEIIGASGKIGVGKNFIAEKVLMKMLEPTPTMIVSFADQIKVNGIVQHGLDRYKCFVEKDEHTRKIMQRVGTEEGRNVYGQDIWLRYTLEWMVVHASRGIKRFIIPDVRFHNEFDFIKNLGGTMIRVNAIERNKAALEREAAKGNGTAESIGSHQSETELDSGRTFDYVIDNDFDAPSVFIQVRDMIRDMRTKSQQDLVIFCDLDNTICECNTYYAEQAEKVKGLIRKNLRTPLADVLDKLFTEGMKRHNGQYAHSHFQMDRFARSLSAVVDDFASYMYADSVESTKQEAYRCGMEVFDHSYREIDGRIDQLKEASKLGRVVLFTMGDRLEQVKKISELKLMDYDHEVFDFKDATIFRHLMKKYAAKRYCMIGDSLHNDVLPALQAGIDIVMHIRNDNESYWENQRGDAKEYVEVSNFSSVSDILREKMLSLGEQALDLHLQTH